MSIVFEPLDSGETLGALNATIPPVAALFVPEAYAALRAVLPPASFDGEGSIGMAPPQYMGLDASLPPFFMQTVAILDTIGAFNAVLPASIFTGYGGARLMAVLPHHTAQITTAEAARATFPLELQLFFSAEFTAPLITEDFEFFDDASALWMIVIQSVLNMSDSRAVLAKLQATVSSSVIATDLFGVIFQSQIDSTIDFTDTPEAVLRMVYLLADQLTLEDDSVPHVNALVLVASAMVLGAALTPGFDGLAASDIEVTPELLDRITMIVEMVSELEAEDAAVPHLLVLAAIDSDFTVGDDPTALVAAIAELLDTVSIGVSIQTPDGDSFIGYSLNTRNSAVSEYDNYPFNSFAVIGGVAFGAGPDGIYRLDGDDDEGAPINASVYTGLSDFGNNFLKRVPSAWIGLTSTGDMVLKTVTTDKGYKKENWYRMKARPGGSPVDSRFDPAKGLLGRYWGFELANLDGADFTLDGLKVWPLSTNRRYSGR